MPISKMSALLNKARNALLRQTEIRVDHADYDVVPNEVEDADLSPISPKPSSTLWHSAEYDVLANLAPDEYVVKEKKLLRKIDLRLMPCLFMMIVLKLEFSATVQLPLLTSQQLPGSKCPCERPCTRYREFA